MLFSLLFVIARLELFLFCDGISAPYKYNYYYYYVCCLLPSEVELQIGTEVEGVVLHITVDDSNTCLELSVDSMLVRSVSRRAESLNMDRARVGQSIKAQVALIKDDFVLLNLKQHAKGMMAWIPRRQVCTLDAGWGTLLGSTHFQRQAN